MFRRTIRITYNFVQQKLTGNLPIADKPRDAFVQMQWRARLPKTRHVCYLAELGRFRSDGTGVGGGPKIMGTLWLCSHGMMA